MQGEITQPQGNYTTSRPPLPGDLAEVTSREPSLTAILSALRMPKRTCTLSFRKKNAVFISSHPSNNSPDKTPEPISANLADPHPQVDLFPSGQLLYDADLQHECENFFPRRRTALATTFVDRHEPLIGGK
jgi:hypothetical protein